MIAGGVAKRYARALFSLASAEKQTEAFSRQLTAFAHAWDTSAELRTVFENPAYSPEVRKKVVVGLAERLGALPTVKNALQLLADRGRIRFVREIADAFAALTEASEGVLRAEIITATDLPETYFAQLEKTLAASTGKKVVLVRKKDPSLVGGVVTKVGDKVYDGSLRARLMDLRSQMLSASSPSGRASSS